jgi:hypothetical protein
MKREIRRRWGFGGPWMRGRKIGQLALFMIWEEEWVDGEVSFAWVIFNSRDWVGF